jgi:hypothetical protein
VLEHTTINGRPAVIAYLKDDMTPADKETATLLKVTFEDDHSTLWLRPDE